MYSSTFSLTSTLDVDGWSAPRHGHSTPGEETQYPQHKGLPRVGLDGCSKFHRTGTRSPDRHACSQSLYQLSIPSTREGA